MLIYKMRTENMLLKLIILVILCVVVVYSERPVARTPLGEVKGHYLSSREGRQISAFTSIPFALPPVGSLRFKAPVAVGAWEKPLEATQSAPLCVQRNPYIRQKEIVGQEDCLYLNIYTPYDETELSKEHALKPLPVLVWFHGGGWMCGGSAVELYGPEYLLDQNVVLVTVNYRLGPLGFLSTQDKHCPGNNGLKDQQEALRFTQKVIHSFGGDNGSVTLFGESAGGTSAHYHMLSETSTGLFHKGISQSGTAQVPWAEAPPGEALRNAFRLAKLLDCPQAPSDRMLACLRTKDSYEIINTEFRFYVWDYEAMIPFKAVVEPDLPGAFLTRNVRKIPRTPAVPWMSGLTRDEGCLKSGWITSNTTRFQEFMAGFDTIAPVSFYYENSPYVDIITKKIKNMYLKDINAQNQIDFDNTKSAILNMYTDSYFAYPVIEAVELMFNYTKKPVFLYELAYKAVNSFSEIFGVPEGDSYICHADDLMYLFPIYFLSKPVSDRDIEMSKLIITMWTNFATSGNPNKPNKLPFKWEAASSAKRMEYLEISEKPTMKLDLGARSRFWGSLPLWHNVRTRRFLDEL